MMIHFSGCVLRSDGWSCGTGTVTPFTQRPVRLPGIGSAGWIVAIGEADHAE